MGLKVIFNTFFPHCVFFRALVSEALLVHGVDSDHSPIAVEIQSLLRTLELFLLNIIYMSLSWLVVEYDDLAHFYVNEVTVTVTG